MAAVADAPEGYAVTLTPPTRNLEQNALMWVYLEAFAQQLFWPILVAGVPIQTKLAAEEWKDILTAAFKQETARIAPGLNGGFVLLGMRTSKMSKRQFAEFIEFLQSVAADRGVVLDEVTA